ncbi:hypothetical protein [Salinisphaera orenii]|uniref:hypothetical protein n=1 Tax=Salinisphaera orenii TaxID=856731 RepID=UPI0011CD8088|nr:hypothetical protein [Salinisphaera halophila]
MKIAIPFIFILTLATGCSEPRDLVISRAIYHNCTNAWLEKYDVPNSELKIYTAKEPMPVKQNHQNYGTDLFFAVHHSVVYADLHIACMTDSNFQVLWVSTVDSNFISEKEWKNKIDSGVKFRNYHKFKE